MPIVKYVLVKQLELKQKIFQKSNKNTYKGKTTRLSSDGSVTVLFDSRQGSNIVTIPEKRKYEPRI